jgi:hypothetical protein
MKKIILVILVVVGSVALQKASAQVNQSTTTTTTTTHRYYYYPEANVYFDPDAQSYWYYDQPETKWITTRNLPGTIQVKKTPRYIVRYNGTDPYSNNAEDVKKFKIKRNGSVKVKTND